MTKKKKTTTKKDIETFKEEQLQKTGESSIPNISLKSSFPIVGIGASAGGLAAFEAFFSGMPTDSDPGMAFVLVQHLAPDHKSILSELIKRYTRMQVFEVEDGMKVQPNCVYIIPPNRDMALLNGTLQLMELSAPRGLRLPIDFFFRSLAQDQREQAICIVLSGTGSDGTLGVRAVKGECGMVMAQNTSTEYDGMPRSAIATGLVDYELPPAEMPAQLIKYVNYAFGRLSQTVTTLAPKDENALKKIFILLRGRTGHDFSQYKPSTVNRRIERRMAVHQIKTIDRYVQYLQETPVEVEALFQDLLIGVTNFFRDPEAFQALEQQVIPKLFAGKPAGGVIRVWSPGCSTGEEAYSLAILLQERMEAMKQVYKVQIFATDIDSQSIAIARNGFYPASITADLSPERLARFFTAETDRSAYRIHKTIRDLLVFSEQDMIKDPPFSKLNLISCRNLLIYMGNNLQKYIIPLFHYALNPGGFLFLGISETVGEFNDLFTTLDRKLKLYQRRDDIYSLQSAALGRFLPPITMTAVQKKADTGKMPLREMTEKMLLQQLAPVGMLVNGQGDIIYLHGRTGLYLEPAPGEAGVNNILKMAREGLRYELSLALHQAAVSKEMVRHPGLRVKTNGDFITVNLAVHPVASRSELTEGEGPIRTPETPLYLVILEQVSPFELEKAQMVTALHTSEGLEGSDARLVALKKELRAKDEYLQTSNEELKSSNEELQSTNEELQSTNEELETSKEELQSLNEELDTINIELQTKVLDLSRANNDMNNLLAGTGIGTVFVDRNLHILRFTPAATKIINLILSDVGRPVGHIVSNLMGYDSIVADIQAVLDTLIPKEVEVQTQEGLWYMMRILPYRTQENVIEGVVITFVDISEIKKMEKVQRLAVIVRDAHDAIILQDLKGCILNWNPAAVKMYGWSEAEALTMNIRDLISESIREKELAIVKQLSQSEVLKPYRAQRVTKDGRMVEVLMTATAVMNEAGEIYAITTTAREIRQKKLKQNQLPKGVKS
ncbi:chemotaxis protein CheR [Candidatus Atribacteria bacterium RBG_19FT_COMBO_35_14]|uniref:protein-glutamate O-methyltransferase n=1 Tax=Candidatus Sediminicultor quintus TaxID=1797291 RepID=A0A1F5A6Z2_9BACT|nr:MAG: chemotaxis protein CheR [Candidatus Atribacteria bacterium RBG_19FT_COMBO_35_14]